MLKIYDRTSEEGFDFLRKYKTRSSIENLKVMELVGEIINNVKKDGDIALIEYTKKFDNIDLDIGNLKVKKEEIEYAYKIIDKKLLDSLIKAKDNIWFFHDNEREQSWFELNNSVMLGKIVRAIETVGIYVPGGTAPLPSSVLMNAIPAKVAGVERIVMTTPPTKDGTVDPLILVAAYEAGVDEIYKIGGAQAIAAMAYGTDTIPKVDKICGPGNIYVTAAKKQVFGICDIDMIAGPSEILVIADETAVPEYVAADILSQAEHDRYAASVLVTVSKELALRVIEEVTKQAENLPRKDIIFDSLKNYGAVILVKDIESAIKVSNHFAPEHLELCIKDAFSYLGKIKNAGAVFIGNYSPEPLGDYYAGPNHVLPTNGTARFFSPLSVRDFYKFTSIISYDKDSLLRAALDIEALARSEKLDAHANAIEIRRRLKI